MPRTTTGQECLAVPFTWLFSTWAKGPGPWLSCSEHGPTVRTSCYTPRPPSLGPLPYNSLQGSRASSLPEGTETLPQSHD